jgi:hypothetical protein
LLEELFFGKVTLHFVISFLLQPKVIILADYNVNIEFIELKIMLYFDFFVLRYEINLRFVSDSLH